MKTVTDMLEDLEMMIRKQERSTNKVEIRSLDKQIEMTKGQIEIKVIEQEIEAARTK